MRSQRLLSQAFASLKNSFLPGIAPQQTMGNCPARTGFNRELLVGMALSLTLAAGGWASAKTVQVQGVRYQPEGLVIQLAGGKVKTPAIETWPNMKDGVKTELIIIRVPNCDGNFEAMQQAATQEISAHPEIKQFWVTPLEADKSTGQGLQIALEVVTTPEKPEFTPEVLSQGDDQWVITLQSVASKLSNRPIQPEKMSKADSEASATEAESAPQPVHRSRKNRAEENATSDSSQKANENTQNLVAALNQAKQKQAELGAQVVTLQQSLAESNAEKEKLKSKVESFESLIEASGVNSNDLQKEDQAVIQNLKTALMKVAQKLKATEDELARQQGKHNEKPSQPLRNLVHNEEAQEDGTPVAAMGMLGFEEKAASANATTSKPRTTDLTAKKIASAALATMNVYHAEGLSSGATPAVKPTTKSPQTAKNTEARLQQAIRKNPLQVDNYLSLADYYVANKDWKNAQTTLTSLTQVEPGGAQGYYYLAMIYLSQKDRTHAQTALWQYAKRNPKDVKGIRTLKKALQANSPTGNATSQTDKAPAKAVSGKTPKS